MWVTGVEFHTPLNRFNTVGQITRTTVIYLFNYTEYIFLFLPLHLDSFNFRKNNIQNNGLNDKRENNALYDIINSLKIE
jgi:hypothetical protein